MSTSFATSGLWAVAHAFLLQARPPAPGGAGGQLFVQVLGMILIFVVLTLVALIPQAFGLGVYRLLKSSAGLFAALAGFLVPPLLYCAVFAYLWYNATPTPAGEVTGDEGDIVVPAVIGYGLVVNLAFGLILYGHLTVKHLRRGTSAKGERRGGKLP